jgi:hypothetical protein
MVFREINGLLIPYRGVELLPRKNQDDLIVLGNPSKSLDLSASDGRMIPVVGLLVDVDREVLLGVVVHGGSFLGWVMEPSYRGMA